MLSRSKKTIVAFILISLISVNLLFAFPKPAKAQFVVETPSLTAWEVVKDVGKKILANIMQSGVIALLNAAQSFTQKIAYDTAVYVASGGSGQKPLFDGKSFSDYIADTARNAGMSFITDFSDKTLGKYGFDICKPNLALIAKIKLGALGQINILQPQARCDWQTMVNNWESFGKSFSTGEVLKNFGIMFEPGNSDLGLALEFNGKVLAETERVRTESLFQRATQGPWKDVTDIITGKVETPADMMRDWVTWTNKVPQEKQLDWMMQTTPTVLQQGAYAILPTMLSTFTNTLLNKSMSRLIGGIFPSSLTGDDVNNGINSGSTGSATPAVGRRQAQEIYSDLIKPKILTSSNYDPLIEFSTCPDKEEERQINNCVLDDSFASAVRLADQGQPLSVREAVEQGYLDGAKPLISSRDSRNQQSDCYRQGYCYSNLVKLRNSRIIPVGFELAADLSDNGSVNLKTVYDNFNDCGKDANGNDTRDSAHPYCHLIDPNWILEIPKMQCQARVYGPTLVSTAGNLRAEVCADPVSCIATDEDGNCIGGYGYCTKEKNIWRISADKCSEQFNSCLTYSARNGKIASYLKNTVDFGVCTAENAGCAAFSAVQKGGNWSAALGNEIYFNKNVEVCDEGSAGCTELLSKKNGLAYNLLPNPSFETNAGNSVSGWFGGASLVISTDGTNAFDGQTAIVPVQNLLMLNPQVIKLQYNTPYSFSAYVKRYQSNKYAFSILFYTDLSAASAYSFDAGNLVSTCKVGTDKSLQINGEAGDDYTRVSCAFLTPSQTLYARVILGGNSWIDAVQLEEGAAATTFLSSGYGNVATENLKIAPSYLDCQAGGNNPLCANYAPTCLAEEVGCQTYNPSGGGAPISGVATVNDVCPASCVGYETYRQEATVFESEKFPNYFIPTTAKSCPAQDAGCDEFTNLTDESKEYFTFVRQCIKPGEAADAVFYTWEGSDTSGYQLKSHRLQIAAGSSANPEPAYIINTDPTACTKAIFQAKFGDADYNYDCREIYNAQGSVFYKLFSKTIISSADCADYRKTDSDQANCVLTGGTWNASGGYCVYKGYKPESIACAALSNGCRAYSGAAAGNTRYVLQDDFESGASGWNGGSVSSESLSAGGHSYKTVFSASVPLGSAAQNIISKDLSGLVSANGFYTVSFWAKSSTGGKLQIGFRNSRGSLETVVAGSNVIDLRSDWKYYQIGPFILPGNVGPASLGIALFQGTGFYIDNIILQEAAQKTYLVKNSWITPAECDKTISGLPLPQAMLGCKAYSDKDKNQAYFKSFGFLCRAEAVGCSAFVNTNNSKSDKNEIYNAICARADTAGGDCQYNGATVCNVGIGQRTCRFKITNGPMPAATYVAGSAAGIYRDASTVEVPADKTIYIVDDQKYHCQAKDLTCSPLGKSELYTKNFTDAYYKNNPETYSDTLCTAPAEGCESWTSAKGADYFKAPAQTCEYKNNEQGIGGWYKSGTEEPCYAGLTQSGSYGIWRNADAGYNGSVGFCPASQNLCTEFIDPNDTSSANKSGQPYYLIDNDKLQTLKNDQSCNGKVSLEEGCVLFHDTSQADLKWSALETYVAADAAKKLVAPVTASYCEITPALWGWTFDPLYGQCGPSKLCPQAGTQLNQPLLNAIAVFFNIPPPPGTPTTYTGRCVPVKNVNTVLKVTRDRQCGEWLACKSSYTATDPITQKVKPVCTELGLCNKYQVNGSGVASCANFITSNPDSGKILSADNYSKRQVGWGAKEYSGFSIGGQVPVTDIVFQNLGNGTQMFGKAGQGTKAYDLGLNEIPAAFAEKSACRGYAEQDSPYPYTIGTWDINGQLQQIPARGLQNANICEYENNCDCDYTKLTYGSQATVKYVEYGNRDVASGICQGGSRSGLPCKPGVTYDEDKNNSCGKPEEGGTCLKLQRQDDVIGWSGYCLQRDLSTPINGDKNQNACLTWMPQDLAPGQRDIYNQFRTAGYIAPIGGGKYYCLQGSGYYSDLAASLGSTSGYDNLILTEKESAVIDDLGSGDSSEEHWNCQGICGIMYNSDRTTYYINNNIIVANGVNYQKDVTRSFLKEFNGDTVVTSWMPATSGLTYPYYSADTQPATGPYQYKYYFKNPQLALSSDLSVTKPIYKDDIDLIRIKFMASGAQDDGAAHPNVGAVFYVNPAQKIKNYSFGTPCTAQITDGCSGEEGVKGLRSNNQKARSVIDSSGSDGEKWYFRYQYVHDETNVVGDYLTTDLFAMRYSFGGHLDFPILCENAGEGLRVFQLAFEFDKTGLLKDIGVVACTGDSSTDNSKNGFRLQVTARMRETCEIMADTAAFQNRAQTNTLWASNPNNRKGAEVAPLGLPYSYNYEIQPFGSAASDISPEGKSAWYSYYTIGMPNYAGVPWSCKDSCGTAKASDDDKTTVDFEPSIKNSTVSGSNLSTALGSIGKLFAYIYNVFRLDRETGTYDLACGQDNGGCASYAPSLREEDKVIYPQIWSYNANNPKQLGLENRVSVANLTGSIDVTGNQYLAVLRFYAWADTNHMPLKSIRIEWGDSSITETTDGLYKNHKPICAKTSNEELSVCSGVGVDNVNMACEPGGAPCPNYSAVGISLGGGYSIINRSQSCTGSAITFGNSPDACEENYFEFQHVYMCNLPSGLVCEYTPQVTVTDNWGIKNSFEYGSPIRALFGSALGPVIRMTQ